MTDAPTCRSTQANPYGEEITSTSNDSFKFAQTYRDSDSGLDYAVKRYYSPNIGRFLTPDHYKGGATPTDPQSWNSYGYAGNDPINHWDPNGLIWVWVGTTLCTVGVGDNVQIVPCDTFARMNISPENPIGLGSDAQLDEWDNLSTDCQNALKTAMPGKDTDRNRKGWVQALNRGLAAESTLTAAAASTGIDWTLLAAIGIRETHFLNTNEADGAGVGVGVLQLTVSPTSGVTAQQAAIWRGQRTMQRTCWSPIWLR